MTSRLLEKNGEPPIGSNSTEVRGGR